MITLENARVTQIEFFDESWRPDDGPSKYKLIRAYTAVITIDNELVICVCGGDKEETRMYVPEASEANAGNEELQEWAFITVEQEQIAKFLEDNGITPSFEFFRDNEGCLNN